MSLNLIRASNGSGEAVQATVTALRNAGSTTLNVDSVNNWPNYFIATTGTKLADGSLDPATVVVFRGHLDGTLIIIDALAAGYTDQDSSVGDIVVIKPATEWADNIADTFGVSMNDDGSLKTSAVNTALEQNSPGWVPLSTTLTTITNNGQRSYSGKFAAVDLTDRLSPGMRLRTTRSAAAPTQCASLNGTNQYFVDTTPAGMTWTDDFAGGIWVKPTSYATGAIMTRFNGTNGWGLLMLSTGQVQLVGYNGGEVNNRNILSYQSLPLNKWTHISGQLDMNTWTNTPTTNYLMFDGVDVPVALATSGTAPTALVQAGNFEIGSRNGGTLPFPGKVAQGAIFSAKVTQATMRTYMSQGLSGTEASLVSAWSLSNSLEDLSANNNDLTAMNAATTTNADAPWGGQANGTISSTVDYGIIQKVELSGADTLVTVQTPEGCTIPTSGGVASVSYSSVKAPYGFPSEKGKWSITAEYNVNVDTAAVPSSALTYPYGSLAVQITAPVGKWNAGYDVSVWGARAAAGAVIVTTDLTTSTTDVSKTSKLARTTYGYAIAELAAPASAEAPISVDTQVKYYLHPAAGQTGLTALRLLGSYSNCRLELDNAYL